MKSAYKLSFVFLALLILSSCNNKKPETPIENSSQEVKVKTANSEELITGIYETKQEQESSDDCEISLEITKTKEGYTYFLKTKARQVKGIANFTKNESGESYLTLEGIKWDEYEGDISNQEENDSISDSETTPKDLEIPVGIGAGYVKDTLTIQNYGNSMNSYTKLSECGRKYIQLIKK